MPGAEPSPIPQFIIFRGTEETPKIKFLTCDKPKDTKTKEMLACCHKTWLSHDVKEKIDISDVDLTLPSLTFFQGFYTGCYNTPTLLSCDPNSNVEKLYQWNDCVEYFTVQVILVTQKPQAEIEVNVRFQAGKVPEAITIIFHKNVRNIIDVRKKRTGNSPQKAWSQQGQTGYSRQAASPQATTPIYFGSNNNNKRWQ